MDFDRTIREKVINMKQIWGNEFDQGDFRGGGTFYLETMIQVCEEWCGMNAYITDYDAACDEHTCNHTRGRVLSAEDLLDFIKTLGKK